MNASYFSLFIADTAHLWFQATKESVLPPQLKLAHVCHHIQGDSNTFYKIHLLSTVTFIKSFFFIFDVYLI